MVASYAHAEPWLEAGDRTLRSDIEILATRGLIDAPMTTWPIPAGQLDRLSDTSLLEQQPTYVQLAAKRVLRRLIGEGQPEGLRPEADLRITSQPNVVHDFGAVARNEFDARAGVIWDEEHISAALKIGDQSHFNGNETKMAFDGSYLSLLYGNCQIYGGWVDQWYGPGWTSSLILSNNARPFPKIGVMRNSAQAFDSPWLSWLGPWQINSFVGLLDGARTITDTAFGSLRITFMPARNFEVGLTRTTEFCGKNQKCNPIVAAFHFNNSNTSANSTNDESAIDLRYSKDFGSLLVSPYAQLMNEDNGPFTHAATSYLAGASLAGPLGQGGAHWRMIVEYSDTVASLNAFDFGKKEYGAAYNNSQYVDGMRYRDRTLGFSLDSDSRLFSLVDLVTDSSGRSYRVTYYRANINDSQLASLSGGQASGTPYNSVSAHPVLINEVEFGLSIPFRLLTFDFAVRRQDAQVFPDPGGKTSADASVSYRF
jgi:hypothetical protein